MKKINEIIVDLVTEIFDKHKVIVDKIKVDDFDIDRVYINNNEFILRMWDVYGDGVVEYTLYKTISKTAMRIGAGRICSSKRFAQLLKEDAEQKYLEYYEHNKD